ncbi:MAG: 2-amino-4-hydroxy-6-hydroxymethyldihydropteridine diphosphokinase [Bacteroidales bacterium]|nr:2-amino-4-hydroxy-6-hydroxymethyldihydropteridine diphosphokinase [Bacteroidales bacterium]
MGAEKVYFSIGTNLGDREANIREALSRMDAAFGKGYSALSSVIETPAWGFDGPAFLNCAVMYEIESDPFVVLEKVKEIERAMGRTGSAEFDASGRRIYHDRPIDIDILYYGDRLVETPELKIPHPLIGERDFVKIPLAEIL